MADTEPSAHLVDKKKNNKQTRKQERKGHNKQDKAEAKFVGKALPSCLDLNKGTTYLFVR